MRLANTEQFWSGVVLLWEAPDGQTDKEESETLQLWLYLILISMNRAYGTVCTLCIEVSLVLP